MHFARDLVRKNIQIFFNQTLNCLYLARICIESQPQLPLKFFSKVGAQLLLSFFTDFASADNFQNEVFYLFHSRCLIPKWIPHVQLLFVLPQERNRDNFHAGIQVSKHWRALFLYTDQAISTFNEEHRKPTWRAIKGSPPLFCLAQVAMAKDFKSLRGRIKNGKMKLSWILFKWNEIIVAKKYYDII